MQTDQNQTTSDKDLVLAAISALKAKGAPISAHTVAEEAHIPRSRLYRDTELMELISEESTDTSSVSGMAEDEAQRKVTELEARILELEESIWNLEKSAEAAVKKQQDAYHSGFQKGVEEATRRLTAGAQLLESSKVDDDQFTISEPALSPRGVQEFDRKSLRDTGPLPGSEARDANSDTGPLPAVTPPGSNLHDSEFIYAEPPARPLRPVSLPFELDFSSPDLSEFTSQDSENSGDAVAAESTAHSGSANPATDTADQPGYRVIATGDFEPFNPSFSFSPSDEIEASPSDSLYASEYKFGDGSLTSEADYDINSLSKSGAGNADSELQSSVQQEAAHVRFDRAPRDPDSIYNVARSGPTVSNSNEFNPLVELSWKDLQNVYNFSVASLKDYARSGVLESKPAAPSRPRVQSTATPAPERAPGETTQDVVVNSQDPNRQDPNRTADRLQALHDPRNLFDTDAVVDLDALDIFDDLDDYVDLDKIDIINDVQVPPTKTQEVGQGGDELRELIKGRIRQAADLPPEPASPRMTTPPASAKDKEKDGDGGAAGGGLAGSLKSRGAANKFVGSAKAGEAPAAPPSPVVRQIPPEIRKSCMILGIKPEEMNERMVIDAWKRQIASPGVHPDTGGDTETAVFLNIAKDTLVRWLDAQAPKLGKKFGQAQQGSKEGLAKPGNPANGPDATPKPPPRSAKKDDDSET